MATVEVLQTDVTTLDVDAITNAANTNLQLGTGVAAAIRDAGGKSIQAECDKKKPIALGDAVATDGPQVPWRWVIHAATVPPDTTLDVVRRATASTLQCAEQLGVKSLGLVAFGAGVGGLKDQMADVAQIEVEEVRKHLAQGSTLDRIVFAVIDAPAYNAFKDALS